MKSTIPSGGQTATADPNDDSYIEDKPLTPENPEIYSVTEVPAKDVKFDNEILQLLHEHPFFGTIGIIVGGGLVVGLTSIGLRFAKCARKVM